MALSVVSHFRHSRRPSRLLTNAEIMAGARQVGTSHSKAKPEDILAEVTGFSRSHLAYCEANEGRSFRDLDR
jgi:hypothetical protein